jgi:hypothetical protein
MFSLRLSSVSHHLAKLAIGVVELATPKTIVQLVKYGNIEQSTRPITPSTACSNSRSSTAAAAAAAAVLVLPYAG